MPPAHTHVPYSLYTSIRRRTSAGKRARGILRNCIVHANSRIWATKNEARKTRLRSLVDRLPGLTRPHDVLELSWEFPTHAFRTVQKFILDLYEEAEELCRRAGAWRCDS
jgi:hypothetical protein